MDGSPPYRALVIEPLVRQHAEQAGRAVADLDIGKVRAYLEASLRG